jgi:putative transcriptional regulator
LSKSKPIKRSAARRATRTPEHDDRENPHLSAAKLGLMKRVAPIKRIRWQLGFSQEEFADQFEIPIGTLRDWEQGRSRPDRPALAYLKVIGTDPAFVSRSLQGGETAFTRAAEIAAKALTNPKSVTVEEVKILAASALTQLSSPQKNRKKAKRPATSI